MLNGSPQNRAGWAALLQAFAKVCRNDGRPTQPSRWRPAVFLEVEPHPSRKQPLARRAVPWPRAEPVTEDFMRLHHRLLLIVGFMGGLVGAGVQAQEQAQEQEPEARPSPGLVLEGRSGIPSALTPAALTPAALTPSAQTPAAPLAPASSRRNPIVTAAERARGAVVNIHSERTVPNPAQGDAFALKPSQNRVNGMGTGILIDPRGYIVTNHHVVEDVSVIRVRLA